MTTDPTMRELMQLAQVLRERDSVEVTKLGVQIRLREGNAVLARVVAWTDLQHVRPMGVPFLAGVVYPMMREQLSAAVAATPTAG